MARLFLIFLATWQLSALSVHGYSYLGCYVDQGDRDLAERVERSGSVSPNRCNQLCTGRNFLFFALQDTEECWCGNSYGKHGVAQPHECSQRCRDNSANCGGPWRNNIYATDYSGSAHMRYIGCFLDSDNRDLPHRAAQDGGVTLPRCNDLCKARNFIYFGMQHGNECWCGNDYGKHGARPENECDKRCSGEGGALCGGGYRNSVYATGYPFLPFPASRDSISTELRAELSATVTSQQIGFPSGVFCDRCLIAAWNRRFGDVVSKRFHINDLNSALAQYPEKVREKVTSLRFGTKTTFDDFKMQIFGNYAVRGSYLGVARRVDQIVETRVVLAEVVAFLVPKHNHFQHRSCSGFWFWTKCNIETIRVRIGYSVEDVELIDRALRSETFKLFAENVNR